MLQLHMIPAAGDATLLRFCEKDKEINILIDGGYKKNACIDYIQKLGIKSIDLLIASHLDEDHIGGLSRIADEIEVKELWVTDIKPLIESFKETGSPYMLFCLYMTSLVTAGRAVKRKVAVYDGYEIQIGPFHLKVLSPPPYLHHYLRKPENIKRILNSPKGQTIKNYINYLKRLLEKVSVEKRQIESEEEIFSQVIEKFEVEIPQIEEIKKERRTFENDDYDPGYWKKIDKFYDKARSLFNDISIVVSITYQYKEVTRQFLFPGDLTNWSIVLAKYPQLIRNRILKVPHHGSEIYYDPEDYFNAIFTLTKSCYFRDFWLSFPHPWLRLWEDWHYYIIRELSRGHIPPIPFCCPFGLLQLELSRNELYDWLSPEISLVYPFKRAKLPKLKVRNQIVRASKEIFCTFEQKKVIFSNKNCCIDCFNCVERDTAFVIEF
ncbi:MBL fold metallo-hydrolase [bacterium]|nr:MBL fold metallo-hydrolase [bacterium]